jgi:hypothetical protein
MKHTMWKELKNIHDLFGMTLTSVEKVSDDKIVFKNTFGEEYQLCYIDDCCGNAYIEDINGELSDLVGSMIVQAEEVSNNDHIEDCDKDAESFTWTFYKLATNKGHVTIRWFGDSNGYYSETATFVRIK